MPNFAGFLKASFAVLCLAPCAAWAADCADGYYLANPMDAECTACPQLPDNANTHPDATATIHSDNPRDSVTNCYADHLHIIDGTGIRKSTLNWTAGPGYKCYSTGISDKYENCPVWTYCLCEIGYYLDSLTGGANKCLPCPSEYYCPERTDGITHTTIGGQVHHIRETGLDNPKACTNKPGNSHYINFTGMTTNDCPWECDAGYGRTDVGTCELLCAAGITNLHAGGLTIPLYKSKLTSPAIHIQHNGQVCYASLAPGAASNALNINYGGNTYHSIR